MTPKSAAGAYDTAGGTGGNGPVPRTARIFGTRASWTRG